MTAAVAKALDELLGQMVGRVRPHRPDGHGEVWRVLLAQEDQIIKWVDDGLTVVKIGILLQRLFSMNWGA